MKEFIYTFSLIPEKELSFENKKIKPISFEKVFTLLIERYAFNYENEYINIHSKELKKIDNNYRFIIEYFESQNIIYINDKYQTGKFTKSYLFTEEFKEKIFNQTVLLKTKEIQVRTNTPKVDNSIKSSKNHVIDYSLQKKLFNDFKSLKRLPYISYDGYFNKEKFIPEFKEALTSFYFDTQHLIDQQGYYKLDTKNNRLYTSFCNVKKEIRDNIFYFNDPNDLENIDIKSSHPFFLCQLLLDDYNNSKIDSYEYHRFLSLIIDDQNDIYEYFRCKFYSHLTRKQVKKLFFILLFGDNESKYKMDELKGGNIKNPFGHNIEINNNFNWEFSSLLFFINDIKHKEGKLNKALLSQALNKLEADFIFNKIIKRAYEELIGVKIVTVHDQIYFSKRFKDQIQEIWDDEYQKLMNKFSHILNSKDYQSDKIIMGAEKKDEADEYAEMMTLENLGIVTKKNEDDDSVSLWDEFGIEWD